MNRPPVVQGRQATIGERRGRSGSASESKPGRIACKRVAKLQKAIDLVGARDPAATLHDELRKARL